MHRREIHFLARRRHTAVAGGSHRGGSQSRGVTDSTWRRFRIPQVALRYGQRNERSSYGGGPQARAGFSSHVRDGLSMACGWSLLAGTQKPGFDRRRLAVNRTRQRPATVSAPESVIASRMTYFTWRAITWGTTHCSKVLSRD